MIGTLAPEVGSPDYVPLKVFNAYLGGGMSSKLFMTLREKEGLAYEVDSFYPTRASQSQFVIYMGLKAERIPEAKDRIQSLLKEVLREPPQANDIEEAKRLIRGTYLMDHQTNARRSHYLGWWECLGKSHTYDDSYPKMIQQVTPEEVWRVAREYLLKPSATVEIYPSKKR